MEAFPLTPPDPKPTGLRQQNIEWGKSILASRATLMGIGEACEYEVKGKQLRWGAQFASKTCCKHYARFCHLWLISAATDLQCLVATVAMCDNPICLYQQSSESFGKAFKLNKDIFDPVMPIANIQINFIDVCILMFRTVTCWRMVSW